MDRRRMSVLRVLGVGVAMLALAWPSSTDWVAIQYEGIDLADPCGDISGTTYWDIVGDASNPSAYVYDDGTNLWFRLRLASSPARSKGGALAWRSFAWGVLIETDWDSADVKYDFMIQVDGNSDLVTLFENTTGDADFSTDAPELDLQTWAAPAALAGDPSAEYAGYEAAGSDVCGGTASSVDYFVDWAVPWADFTAWTGVTSLDEMAFVFGTSASGNTFNKDLAPCDNAADPCTDWEVAISDPPAGDPGDTGWSGGDDTGAAWDTSDTGAWDTGAPGGGGDGGSGRDDTGSGDSGASGDDGSSGDSGASGDDGSSGDSGASGDDGSSGDSGASGDDGSSGDSGASGDDGSSGDDGASGDTGWAWGSGDSTGDTGAFVDADTGWYPGVEIDEDDTGTAPSSDDTGADWTGDDTGATSAGDDTGTPTTGDDTGTPTTGDDTGSGADDSGIGPDAGAHPDLDEDDLGLDGEGEDGKGTCGCAAMPTSANVLTLSLLVGGLVRRRRRP